MNKLRQSPLTQRKARDFQRLMTHQASEVEFDSQGRTLVPSYLREFAGLSSKVVIAGSATRIEIWDQVKYHKYMQGIEKVGEQIAESLSEQGI